MFSLSHKFQLWQKHRSQSSYSSIVDESEGKDKVVKYLEPKENEDLGTMDSVTEFVSAATSMCVTVVADSTEDSVILCKLDIPDMVKEVDSSAAVLAISEMNI